MQTVLKSDASDLEQQSGKQVVFRLKIARSIFQKCLSHVQSVVERRNTIPVLSNVLIEAKSGKLCLTATDMDLSIDEEVVADVEVEGALTAPAHTLYDIVRKLPEDNTITLEATSDKELLVLKSGRSRFTFPVLPVQDFPLISKEDLSFKFNLSADILRLLIDKTRFAISTEETRYYLNGVFFHIAEFKGEKLFRAVATDGHRLARVEVPVPSGAESIPNVILPRKTVLELRKLLEETEGDVSIDMSSTRIMFSFSDVVLTSKLIDGKYPDYNRVIPTENDKILIADCAKFSQAVDRVSTITKDKAKGVKLNLENNTVKLSADSPESGTAKEEFEAKYDSLPIEIGFNSRYLLDIMQQISGDDVKLIMKDSNTPTIVEDSTNESCLYVLMPMRV